MGSSNWGIAGVSLLEKFFCKILFARKIFLFTVHENIFTTKKKQRHQPKPRFYQHTSEFMSKIHQLSHPSIESMFVSNDAQYTTSFTLSSANSRQ